jgi:hypothetical protein
LNFISEQLQPDAITFLEARYPPYSSGSENFFNVNIYDPNELREVNLKEFFSTLPYSEDVSIVYNLNRLSIDIARQTRRGLGKYVLCRDKTEVLNIKKYDDNLPDRFTVFETELVVLYASSMCGIDRPFAYFDSKIYAHPHAEKYIRKSKIKTD